MCKIFFFLNPDQFSLFWPPDLPGRFHHWLSHTTKQSLVFPGENHSRHHWSFQAAADPEVVAENCKQEFVLKKKKKKKRYLYALA